MAWSSWACHGRRLCIGVGLHPALGPGHTRQFACGLWLLCLSQHHAGQRHADDAARARHGGVAVFVVSVSGQSLGVVLAVSLIDRIGSSAVVAVEGVYFAWALTQHGALP
jgi:hypothetical protein